MQNHFNRRKLYKAFKKNAVEDYDLYTEALTESFRKPLLQ